MDDHDPQISHHATTGAVATGSAVRCFRDDPAATAGVPAPLDKDRKSLLIAAAAGIGGVIVGLLIGAMIPDAPAGPVPPPGPAIGWGPAGPQPGFWGPPPPPAAAWGSAGYPPPPPGAKDNARASAPPNAGPPQLGDRQNPQPPLSVQPPGSAPVRPPS